MSYRLNKVGLDILKMLEGFRGVTYLDIAGYPTIGYGHKILQGESYPNGMTQEEAEGLLIKEVALAESYVSSLTKVSMTDDMFSALVLFTYNLGGGAFRASTLRSKLNRFDYAGASKEFPKWTYAGGVSKTGLLRRRLIEQALFNSYLQEIL